MALIIRRCIICSEWFDAGITQKTCDICYEIIREEQNIPKAWSLKDLGVKHV